MNFIPTYPNGWRSQGGLVAGTRSYLTVQGNYRAFGSPEREKKDQNSHFCKLKHLFHNIQAIYFK